MYSHGFNVSYMVVASESMAPAFHRGDQILLWNQEDQIHARDIPVVWLPGQPLPMVHRAVKVLRQVKRNGRSR
jgi:signal peptidase